MQTSMLVPLSASLTEINHAVDIASQTHNQTCKKDILKRCSAAKNASSLGVSRPMKIKPILRIIFKVVIATLVAFAFAYIVSFIPGLEYDYALVVGAALGFVLTNPKSNYAWGIIKSHYSIDLYIAKKPLRQGGFLQDKREEENEVITMITSICPHGIVLLRPHVIPYLMEAAMIPWECIKSSETHTEKSAPKHDSPMTQELKIEGLVPKVEIPWNEDLELFKNNQGSEQEPANKSSKRTVSPPLL
jgi:hypothetical protein